MLRRIYIMGIAAMVSVMAFTGCHSEEIEVIAAKPDRDPVLEIQISRNGYATTRADGTEFTAAEKKIVSVDLFFFASEATDTSHPLHHVRAVPVMNAEEAKSNTGTINTSIPVKDIFGETGTTCRVYAAVNTDVTKNADKETLTLGDLKNLKVTTPFFVTDQLEDEDAADLSDFGGFVMFTSDPDGDVVTYDRDERKVSGKIIVNKSAAKIDLYLGFGPNGGDGTDLTIIAPDPNDPGDPLRWHVYNDDDAVEAFFVNGVQAVRLGGWNGTDFLESSDYFDFREADMRKYARGFKASDETDKTTYPYLVESPFYTYPNEWTTDVLEHHRTQLLLKVNWLPEGGNATTDLLETYYAIPLNVEGYIDAGSENKILPNKYYRVKVKINTLGGQHFGEPLTLEKCSYEILPWGSAKLDAVLRDTRYLEVRQQVEDRDGSLYTAIMNNTNLVTIPLNSSHKVTIESVTIDYVDFSKPGKNSMTGKDQGYDSAGTPNTATDRVLDPNAFMQTTLSDLIDNNWQGAFIDDLAQTITINHPLGAHKKDGSHYEVNTSDVYMYTPYVITIVLNHSDIRQNDLTFNTIRIKQYPPIFIEGEVNTSINLYDFDGIAGRSYPLYDSFVHGYPFPQQRFYGFVRVNSNDHDFSNWGGHAFLAKGGVLNSGVTDNPIMYIITSTVLSNEWSQYHITDPRSNYSNTDLNGDVLIDDTKKGGSGWISARHIDGGSSSLSWYYPTKEDLTENAKWAISPKFRIASSFGAQENNISRQDARKRCAAYTEYGYPAGRWRVPTLGEFKYVMELNKKGVIPQLFNRKQVYYTAQGPYYFDDNNNVIEASGNMSNVSGNYDSGAVRCVYDEWYWDKKPDGSPDHLTTTVEMANQADGNKVFIWGDRERKSPQIQND